jgi:N-acetylglucosamine kinase-like BadF-type ATPase
MAHEKHGVDGGYFLGFDGGGTKTDCVLADAFGKFLARSTAGPSNPLRAGYAKAWFTLSDAADVVLEHDARDLERRPHVRMRREVKDAVRTRVLQRRHDGPVLEEVAFVDDDAAAEEIPIP